MWLSPQKLHYATKCTPRRKESENGVARACEQEWLGVQGQFVAQQGAEGTKSFVS